MEKPKSNKHLAPDSTAVKSVKFENASAAPSKNTTLVKKKGAQAGDPTKMAKPSRTHVTSSGARGGARYGIRVKFQKTEAPEAGSTQANGRLLPPAKPQAPNFKSGMAE